jgi:hypothetical protein
MHTITLLHIHNFIKAVNILHVSHLTVHHQEVHKILLCKIHLMFFKYLKLRVSCEGLSKERLVFKECYVETELLQGESRKQ